MANALRRLYQVYHTEGAWRLVRFLVRRVVRMSSHVIYAVDLGGIPDNPSTGDDEILILDERSVDSSRSRITRFMARQAPEYMDDVASGNAVAVLILIDDTVAHYAFMMTKSRTLCILGVEAESALLGNAYTLPEYRGRGLQQTSLRIRLREAARRGFRRAIAETEPENVPSRRAMEKAGMDLIHEVRIMVILTKAVVRFGSGTGKIARVGWCP